MGSPSCCYLLADVTWKVIRWEIDRICFERDHVVLHRMVVRKQQLKRRLKKETRMQSCRVHLQNISFESDSNRIQHTSSDFITFCL